MNLSFSSSYIALWVLVVFQGLLVVALLKQLEELRQTIDQVGVPGEGRLPVGSDAPDFAIFDLDSKQQGGLECFAGKGGIILFLSAQCSVCKNLADSLRQSIAQELPVLIAFCPGTQVACQRIAERLDPNVRLITQGASEVAARYRVSGFPTAVVVAPDRTIGGYGHPSDVKELKRLWAGLPVPDPDDVRDKAEPSEVLAESGGR